MKIVKLSEIHTNVDDNGTVTVFVTEDIALKISPAEIHAIHGKICEIIMGQAKIPLDLVQKIQKTLETTPENSPEKKTGHDEKNS